MSIIMYHDKNYSMGVGNEIKIDTILDNTSTNPVENKVIANVLNGVEGDLKSHIDNTDNPHNVTAEQLRLGKVENKSSEDIRGEITKENIISALDLPLGSDTVYTHPTYTAKSVGLYKVTVDDTGHVSATTVVTKDDITALGIPAQDTNTTYSDFVKSGSGAKSGLVPAPSTTAGTTKYLREDGTWQTPPDTNTQTITGVKGNAETSYRTGNVNLTAANVQAVPISGGTMTGQLIAQSNTAYTTAQVRNVTMSTAAASGGSNGQIHFQYS